MDREEIVRTLKKLIDIPSPTGQEGGVGDFLEKFFSGMGLKTVRQPLGPSRFNLLATTKEAPKVVFCTHMDVVLPHFPFTRDGNLIRGRGACDAKGSMAAMIAAATRLLEMDRLSFGLLFLVGEEGHSDGARQAAKLALNSEYIVLGEPTKNKVAVGQKGVLVFRMSVHGKAAHSACPDMGRSAVHHLASLVTEWIESDWGGDPEMGENYLNVGRFDGGVGANVVAPRATAEGIFRVGTSSGIVEEKLLSYTAPDVDIEILSRSEPMRLHVPPDADTVVVSFGSDAPHLTPLGRIVLMGPGSIENAHSPDEQITVEELVIARDQYIRLMDQLK